MHGQKETESEHESERKRLILCNTNELTLENIWNAWCRKALRDLKILAVSQLEKLNINDMQDLQ